MSLKDTILSDMKEAMKQGDVDKKNALRMLLSEIQYAQTAIDKSQTLDDKALTFVAGRYKKKLEKSLENYPEGPQKNALLKEISIVSSYLPKEASKEEVEKTVIEILSKSEDKNFGSLMKLCLEKLGESANSKLVSEVIKEKLKPS